MKTKDARGEKGQAAVLITILIMFAFIALTALAIDGGHLYVVRRDFQNMTDAACLAAAIELSLGGDEDVAIAQAREYVIRNGGDFFNTWPGQEPNRGTGVGLTWGIDVTGADVRVALQEDVDTYFTMIFNRRSALVGARSHCNATSAGGLLPIAVRRYEYNEDDETEQLDLLANQLCTPPQECYYHSEGTHDAADWPDEVYRYGPFTVWLPNEDYTPSDGPITSTTTGNIDCDVPPRDDPPEYVGVCILGDGVATNDGTADYKGFVLLDVRNIVPGPVEYLSGATGEPNTNKYISKQWLCAGYTEMPPKVGEQIAMLDGVSNDFAAQEMAACWDVEETFWAIVYSGYVWDIPDLEMSIEPDVNLTSPITDTVSYTVTLEKVGPSPWESDSNFDLESYFMEGAGVITPTAEFGPDPVIMLQGQDSVTVTMTVSATNPVTATYLSALTVRAEERTGVGLKRWASTNFRYEYPGTTLGPDFTLYASALEFNVPQGGSLDIPLTARGFGCAQNRADLSAEVYDPLGTVWGNVFISNPSDKIKIRDGADNNSTFTLKVSDGALGLYSVRLRVTAGCGVPPEDRTHTVRIGVNVYEPSPGGEPKKFVIVEGFAQFKISYIDVDANTVGAYAIGPIVPCLGEWCPEGYGEDPAVVSGLIPRLVPWAAPPS